MESSASATCTTLAARGISSPARPLRVAGPVVALVVMAHGRNCRLEASSSLEHARTLVRVAAHENPLFVGEMPGLVEDRLGDGELADVVKQRRLPDCCELAGLEAELTGKGQCDTTHTP